MRKLPATREPLVTGTCATPYGLTSPLEGTVELRVVTVVSGPMKELAASASDVPPSVSRVNRNSPRTRSTTGWERSMCILLFGRTRPEPQIQGYAGGLAELSLRCL